MDPPSLTGKGPQGTMPSAEKTTDIARPLFTSTRGTFLSCVILKRELRGTSQSPRFARRAARRRLLSHDLGRNRAVFSTGGDFPSRVRRGSRSRYIDDQSRTLRSIWDIGRPRWMICSRVLILYLSSIRILQEPDLSCHPFTARNTSDF